jgi:hypothetical protein
MGNHDYGDYIAWPSPEAKLKNLDYLHEIYKYMGWKLLLNEHVIIHRGSDSIAVIGVENWGGSKRFPRLGDLDKATKGIENTGIKSSNTTSGISTLPSPVIHTVSSLGWNVAAFVGVLHNICTRNGLDCMLNRSQDHTHNTFM